MGDARNPRAIVQGGGGCRVGPLTDRGAIDRILTDPWIAAKITRDGREPGFIDHPLVSYYGAWVDGRLVGVFTLIRFTDIEREVHAALLREALPHGRELGRLFLDIAFADPQVLRVTAHVIGSLPSAVNYCLKLGFKREGVRRDACVQNNRVWPVITLGLLRSEWRA